MKRDENMPGLGRSGARVVRGAGSQAMASQNRFCSGQVGGPQRNLGSMVAARRYHFA
jgi:hypothetical protein